MAWYQYSWLHYVVSTVPLKNGQSQIKFWKYWSQVRLDQGFLTCSKQTNGRTW
jgi:hypothetical protein